MINECHVSINGGAPIYLRAGQGFQMDAHDSPITSFKISESGITYNFLGAHILEHIGTFVE